MTTTIDYEAAPIDFKYKTVGSDGQEQGILRTKGRFDGRTLTLGTDEVPVEAVLHAVRRFDRLVLVLPQASGDATGVALATKRKTAGRLARAINAAASRKRAEAARSETSAEGKAFRSVECLHCDATIDLTGRDESPQVWCRYCDSVQTYAEDAPLAEADLHECAGCGRYATLDEYTIFYFYFLLVVYGWRSRREYRCRACMAPEARKMLLGNLVFLLGVPTALYQVARTHLGGRSGLFGGLDSANAKAKAGKVDAASSAYTAIEGRAGDPCAAVRFNHALAFAQAGRPAEAARHFEKAVSECSNFGPAVGALLDAYAAAGRDDDRRALLASWGGDAPDVPDVPAEFDSVQG